jgi:uncharacterized membrane protein YdjX (TVP38/TMEM64 family)
MIFRATQKRGLPARTLFLLAIVFAGIILPFCLFGDRISAWTDESLRQAHAHPVLTGVLLVSLLAADIVLPVPSSLASTACGMALGFLGGALASFLGMSVSTACGYALGACASRPVRALIGESEADRLQAFHARYGLWMLLALRPVPVLAEASILFSGATRQPLPGVVAATSLGNLAVSAAYAAVGAWGRASDSFLPAFAASLILSGLCMLLLRRKRVSAPAACRPSAETHSGAREPSPAS